MDKFEENIKDSKASYQPRSDFVERTMQRIETPVRPRRRTLPIWITAGSALALLAIVFLAVPTLRNAATNTPASPTSSQTATKNGSSTSQSTSLPAGTDDTSLASDLGSIQSSLNQEQHDQSSATSTLNDSAQQIAIPTD